MCTQKWTNKFEIMLNEKEQSGKHQLGINKHQVNTEQKFETWSSLELQFKFPFFSVQQMPPTEQYVNQSSPIALQGNQHKLHCFFSG